MKKRIDEIVCKWTFASGKSLREEELNLLVDMLDEGLRTNPIIHCDIQIGDMPPGKVELKQ